MQGIFSQVDVTKKNKEDFNSPPREGAYVHGLFMEGARWDTQTGMIAESRLKELTPGMPVMFIRAIPVDKQETKNVYECPVYKTRQRGPTYVWNFFLKTKESPAKWTLAGVALLLSAWIHVFILECFLLTNVNHWYSRYYFALETCLRLTIECELFFPRLSLFLAARDTFHVKRRVNGVSTAVFTRIVLSFRWCKHQNVSLPHTFKFYFYFTFFVYSFGW